MVKACKKSYRKKAKRKETENEDKQQQNNHRSDSFIHLFYRVRTTVNDHHARNYYDHHACDYYYGHHTLKHSPEGA